MRKEQDCLERKGQFQTGLVQSSVAVTCKPRDIVMHQKADKVVGGLRRLDEYPPALTSIVVSAQYCTASPKALDFAVALQVHRLKIIVSEDMT